MNSVVARHTLALLSLTSLGSLANAQMAAPHSEATSSAEDMILLDPFTVTTEHEGYRADDTLAGGRVRTQLKDTPSSLSVVTTKFMQDLGITSAEDLLIYTTNTEVGGLNGNYSGVASRGFGVSGAAEGPRLINPAGTNRSRGLTAMDNTRNYFQSEIPWDGFNISRIDISRGPNSFLFGVGSPSGISNYSTNDAIFKNQGSFEARIGSFGSTRQSFDYNRVLLPSQLAIRVDLLNDDTQYKQDPAYNHSKRAYGALRFDPKFLSTASSHTKLLFNFENGKVDSNNPRELPPTDLISGYFDQRTNKAGFDPFMFRRGDSGADPAAGPWVSQDDIHYAWGTAPTFWYDADGKLLRAGQPQSGGTRADGNGIGGLSGYSNTYHLYTNGFAQYARNINYIDPAQFPGAYAQTVNYLDKTLTDPTIFDFYNKLIDGPNKHEWQNWNSYNLTLVESLFNDRLSIQAVAEHEEYKRGQEGMLTGYWNPYITVDMDKYLLTLPSWLPGAQTNPNVGRPLIGGDFSGGDNSSKFTHTNYQATAAYSLKFDDFMPKSALAKILGTHEFTGLGGKYTTKQEDRTWTMYAADNAFTRAHGGTGVSTVQWVSYLGDSLSGASSASGANLSNISTLIMPRSGPLTYFDNTWSAGSGVNPADSWINPRPDGSLTLTQADNPANYKGFQPTSATILNSQNNINDLYTDGNKKEQVIKSQAIMYQGHLFDDTIVPSFGWRRDKVLQRGTQAPRDATTNLVSVNYDLTDEGVQIDTRSTSYGVAVHLPASIKKRLPEGTDLSLYYFHGNNQTPRVRYGIDGNALPNEEGKTDDYSVQFDGFDKRVTVRLTYFKTVDNYATASYGQPLGATGWLIDSLPAWTLTMAASGIIAAHNDVGSLPFTDGFQSNNWFWGWGQSNPALADQIAKALQTDFLKMFPQSYWDQYGMGPWVDMAAVQRGDWVHVLKNGMSPLTWNVPNNHMIHGVSPTIDQNLESTGYELEATIRPIHNWDITFNASKVHAYQTSLGQDAADYLNNMAHLWIETPIGLTPEWGGSPIRNEFLHNLWGPYLTQVALTGTDQPELRKWNLRFITNYTFDRGFLKGANIGAAYRWADKNVVGYGIKEADIFGNPAWIADVTKPLYGPTDEHVDLWIGYQHRLTAKIDWKAQLNIRNVGESPKLVPISYEPDGTIAQQRIQIGQTYDFSLKFMF